MAGTQLLMGPERLGDVADVVIVAINYRVGSLGTISKHNFYNTLNFAFLTFSAT